MLKDPASRLLSTRRLPLALGSLAFLLTLPALRAGLIGDDYFHRAILLGRGDIGATAKPLPGLFTFVSPQTNGSIPESSYLPWWAGPDLHLSFARPLAALTHVLDYRLWPDSFAMQHLQSLLWFALAVGLVAAFYRRVHGPGLVAGLAGLLFAVEDAHAMSAGWLAARNTVLCLVCGSLLLHQHLTWRRTRRPRDLFLAFSALGVGLGCGEATLGALAYVAAWQCTREPGSWVRRSLPLVPYAAIVVSWRVLYSGLGYGVQGSSLYIDPGTRPILFLKALAERWPLLLAAQWWQAPVDLWLLLPRPAQVTASALAALPAAAVAALLWGLLRRDELARFWAVGMALSLVPLCAAFPMDRLLVFSGIGAFALMAMLCEACGVWLWQVAGGAGWRRRATQVLVVLHVPVAAFFLVARTLTLPTLGAFFTAGARAAPRGPEVPRQTFVFVNGNDFPVAYSYIVRVAMGEAAVPRAVAQLAPMTTTNAVEREDERTLVVAPRNGFLGMAVDRLLADPDRRFSPGETIRRPDFLAEVREVTGDGRPRRVAFRFRQPLEDPGYRWLYWNDGHLVPFPLPAVGQSTTIGPGWAGSRAGERE